MKNVFPLLLTSFMLLFGGIHALAHKDSLAHGTINILDDNGMRQGYWKITGGMLSEKGYRREQTVEEGAYNDNKRNGIWKKYYPSGQLRSEINYENNHPRGYYITYFDNGTPEESGDWQGNRNVGQFERFHRNGKPAQQFTFNELGKRDGIQKYYYPNGNLQMTVEVENGTAHGKLIIYYPDGEIKSEKRLFNGTVDPISELTYKPKQKNFEKFDEPEIPVEETTPSTSDKPNLVEFNSTGFNTLYNRNQQMTQVGMFKDGRLWDGKWHRYDGDGMLRKVEVYKDGRFVGYGIITDSSK